MEPIYLIIVLILMVLAISDLVVGVSNDAVNFLNSAVGSKAAPRRIIMIVASLGILVGVLTSSGMMEVARSGIFHPGLFSFENIMMLLLAVMLTDVILLDVFNTLGLPTSTTVSLVFELLGSAVCVALFIIAANPETAGTLSQYINSAKALTIVSGILSSVVISFVCGAVVMYVTRLLFTFNFKSKVKSIGSLWCGIALTAITYFALFKGLKNTPIIPKDIMTQVSDNILYFTIGAWIFWSVIMFILHNLKVNILKVTVLAGTFALALAFAGNDLVNFIGVFMAGLDSYKLALGTGDTGMMMTALSEPVKANFWILLASGAVMVVTLWISRKARKVTETEVNLSRQESGQERFGSTSVSRGIVRSTLNLNRYIDYITPTPVKNFIGKRFAPATAIAQEEDIAFDLIRATVNLTVAALLVALATSLKLPLSTTYVSFMVAMGTSLADRAWGRESAVYRITGVLTVISGWFLTAFVAFTMAFLVAAALMWGKEYAIIALVIGCGYILYRSNFKKSSKKNEANPVVKLDNKDADIVTRSVNKISNSTKTIIFLYNDAIDGVFKEDLRSLKKTLKKCKEILKEYESVKKSAVATLQELKENDINTGHYYVQVLDYLGEVSKSLHSIVRSFQMHIDNNHEGLSKNQIKALKNVNQSMNEIFNQTNLMLESNNFDNIENVIKLGEDFFNVIDEITKEQLKRNLENIENTRNTVLFLGTLTEVKSIILQLLNLLRSQKKFIKKA